MKKYLTPRCLLKAIYSILVIIPAVYTLIKIKVAPEYLYAVLCMVAGLALGVVSIVFVDKKWSVYTRWLATIAIAGAATFFLLGGSLSIADWVSGIHLFGDATQVPVIFAFTGLLIASGIVSIVDNFLFE